MKRKTRNTWLVCLVLSSLLALQACASAPVKMASGEYANGLYINKSPALSVQLPGSWSPVTPENKETFRILDALNDYKLPVATLVIRDKATDAQALDSDATATDYLNSLKEQYPKSAGHKVLSKQMITLSDGTPAMALDVKWTWVDGSSTLLTAVLVAYKEDKAVTLVATNYEGGMPGPKGLLDIIKTLKFL
jgi:hypothetical protein